jgi:hypothetical protein
MTDVLMTVALIAVVGGITATKYADIKNKMSNKILNSNTMAVNKVFQSFQTLGCRFSSISNSGQSADVQAAALTQILQSPSASGAKSQEGLSVTESSTDMVLVPFPTAEMPEDGRIRIAFNSVNGSIVTANSGSGFIPLSVSQNADLLAKTRGTPSDAAITALVSQFSSAQSASINGYAYNDNSTANEDTAIYGSPLQVDASSIGSSLTTAASGANGISAASISANPSVISFGNVLVGAQKQVELTVFNPDSSTNNLSISSIVADSGISIDTNSAVIAPGSFRTFTVTFSPAQASQLSGSLRIISNAANTPNGLVINCTGKGTSGSSETQSHASHVEVITAIDGVDSVRASIDNINTEANVQNEISTLNMDLAQ